jgi:adenylate kinase
LERILNPSCYVFVTAPPEVIAERVQQRNQKGERKSPELPIAEIESIQQTKLDIMGELTSALDCDLLVLNNVDGELDSNVHVLGERIGNLGFNALSRPQSP